MASRKQITIFSKRILLYLLVAYLSAYPASTQLVTFNRVSLPEGSYFGLVNDVSQDPLGYMWFASYVFRLDLFHSTIQHFPIGNIVHAIHDDVSYVLWINAPGGEIKLKIKEGEGAGFITILSMQ